MWAAFRASNVTESFNRVDMFHGSFPTSATLLCSISVTLSWAAQSQKPGINQSTAQLLAFHGHIPTVYPRSVPTEVFRGATRSCLPGWAGRQPRLPDHNSQPMGNDHHKYIER